MMGRLSQGPALFKDETENALLIELFHVLAGLILSLLSQYDPPPVPECLLSLY